MLELIHNIDVDILWSTCFALLFLTALAMSKQNHLVDNIKTYAFQSFLIFVLTLLLLTEHFSIHLLITAVIVLVVKVFLFPIALARLLKSLHIHDQFENITDIQFIFLAIGALTAFSFWLLPVDHQLDFLQPRTYHVIPLSMAIVFIGLLLMINRTKTISQILGFLVMENGISLAILLGVNNFSSVLEFGLAIDLLVGVLIMGIFSNRIKTDLDHIEVRQLSKLKDDLE